MKIKFVVIVMIAACFISGCSLVDQFNQAKDQYLETRVVDLLNELPTEATEVVETEVVSLVETVEVLTDETQTVDDGSDAEEKAVEVVEATEEAAAAEATTEADMAPEATVEPVVTATVESDDPAVYLGEAFWTDEMDTAEFWPSGSDDFTSAEFGNGKLSITALNEINGWRIASTPVLENAYIEADVKMGTCSSTDGYGFIFRVPENTGYNQGYLFGITCDGRWSLRKWNGLSGANGVMTNLQNTKTSTWINKGKDQSNRIGVMMLGNRLVMFINGEKVGEVTDDAYSTGFFGLYINRDTTEKLNILVDSVSYWVDPQEK